MDEGTGKVLYEAESPDEAAFVIAARELGFEFYKRTQTSISVRELDRASGKKVERSVHFIVFLDKYKFQTDFFRVHHGNLISKASALISQTLYTRHIYINFLLHSI